MHYEVFIPSTDSDGFDTTITVEALNWMAALKSGLERIGEGSDVMKNVMCDIKSDNSIHVTDATSRRVFVLREVSIDSLADEGTPTESGNEESSSAVETASTDEAVQATPSAEEPAVQPESTPAESVVVESAPAAEPEESPAAEAQTVLLAQPQEVLEVAKETTKETAKEPEQKPAKAAQAEPPAEAAQPAATTKPEEQPAPSSERLRVGSSSQQALRRDEDQPRIVKETRQKTDENKALNLGRANEKVSETLIEDVFLEIQDIHENNMSMEEVINFVMDMSVDKLNAESGAILLADVNGKELYFATARGPKAKEVLSFRVPMSQGLAGFCAREGVSLAINDAQKDPRFYKEISQSLGYETRSLLCVPIQQEGQIYGVIEVINKKSGSHFSSDETNALAYIGRQLARYIFDVVISKS